MFAIENVMSSVYASGVTCQKVCLFIILNTRPIGLSFPAIMEGIFHLAKIPGQGIESSNLYKPVNI